MGTKGLTKLSGSNSNKTLSPRIFINSANSSGDAGGQNDGQNEAAQMSNPTTFVGGDSIANYSNSRLLMKSSELLSPPAYSPFSVLTLKEEKKFKPTKVVSEMPWAGLPGEQLAQVSKSSYSIRVKVALLADMAISSLSVKLDMITDLLVIIDSVKGNRGFVVFATTHVPYILDPALRRPGRLDETITLASMPTILSRWEVLKSSFGNLNMSGLTYSKNKSQRSSLGLSRGFTEQTGFSKGVTLDPSLTLMSSINSIQYFQKNFKTFIAKNTDIGKIPFKKNTITRKNQLSAIFKDDLFSAMILNPKKIISSNGSLSKENIFNTKLPLAAKLQRSGSGRNSLLTLSMSSVREKIIAQTYFMASLMVYKASSLKLNQQNLTLTPQNVSLAVNSKENKLNLSKSGNNGLPLSPSAKRSGSGTNVQLFDLPVGTTEASSFYLSFYSAFGSDKSAPENPNFNNSSVTAEPPNQKGTFFTEGVPLPLRFTGGEMKKSGTSGESQPLKDQMIQFIAGKLGEMLYFSKTSNLEMMHFNSKTHNRSSVFNHSGIYTSYGLKTWQMLSSLVVSFVQKRFIYNQNLIVPNFLSFSNNNPLMEAPSPPASNILLPARRYENYKRSVAFFSGNKTSLGIMEKIQLHQQQRLVKRLYRYPVQETFRSEIIENRLTGFSNAALMIGSLSDILQKPSRSNWFIKNRILNRHRNYFTNQWWTGQLPEHNAETTFLSDIDWRYTFVESVGDLLLDFPDADQYYNPRNRRWILTKGGYQNWFDLDKTMYSEIYSHFIFDSFVKAYHIFEQNREGLDYYAVHFLQNGLHNTVHELDSFKLYKRFFN